MKTNLQASSVSNEHQAMRARWHSYIDEQNRLKSRESKLSSESDQLLREVEAAQRELDEITPVVFVEGQARHPDTSRLNRKIDSIGLKRDKILSELQECRDNISAASKALPDSIVLAIPVFREKVREVEHRAATIAAHITEQEEKLEVLQQQRADADGQIATLRAKISLSKAHALLSGQQDASPEELAKLATLEAAANSDAAEISNIEMLLEGLSGVQAAVESELKLASHESRGNETRIARIVFDRERKALIEEVQSLVNARMVRLHALGQLLHAVYPGAYDVLEDCRLTPPNRDDVSRVFHDLTTAPA